MKTVISERDLVRLAAYIDCEGCIRIQRDDTVSCGFTGQLPRYSLLITVGNNDPRMALWLRDNFKGKVYKRRQKLRRWNGEEYVANTHFVWNIVCTQAADVLKQCLPYLLLKRDQAEVAIAFQRTLSKSNQGHKLSSDVLQQRELAYQSLKDMKQQDYNTYPLQ